METDFSSKICYTVFHIDKPDKSSSDYVREHCVKKIREYVTFDNLDSPTISIKTLDEVKSFLSSNPSFILDPKGFDPEYKRKEHYYNKEEASSKGWQLSTIGIWASSYTAYKNFLQSDYDYLLIFEDDILVKDNFMKTFLSYLKELPTSWDVFYHFNPEVNVKVREVISENICRPNQIWSNACYVVSRQGAKKIVESAEKEPGVYLPIDWHILKQQHMFDTYTVRPRRDSACRLVSVNSTYYIFENMQDLTGLL
jgi:GR25 family glycosyltransferase involved in LPS biosynthesis